MPEIFGKRVTKLQRAKGKTSVPRSVASYYIHTQTEEERGGEVLQEAASSARALRAYMQPLHRR